MQSLVFMLEYGKFPIRLLNDDLKEYKDFLLLDDKIFNKVKKIQNSYDNLFICDRYSFSYLGFSSPFEKLEFLEDIEKLVVEINEKFPNIDLVNSVKLEDI